MDQTVENFLKDGSVHSTTKSQRTAAKNFSTFLLNQALSSTQNSLELTDKQMSGLFLFLKKIQSVISSVVDWERSILNLVLRVFCSIQLKTVEIQTPNKCAVHISVFYFKFSLFSFFKHLLN